MFLDDKLIQICKDAECEIPEQIQQLNIDICIECEIYYKSKLTHLTTEKELKVILDRTFNLFDSFVKIALKSEDSKLRILGDMFKKHTFKSQFLKNEEMSRIYNSIST